jgi:S-adenosyl-L-methionine hydrolase (adenosine-forming)
MTKGLFAGNFEFVELQMARKAGFRPAFLCRLAELRNIMIVLCTDFGLSGPYLGQVHNVLVRQAPDIPIVNLFADLPAFQPRAAAYLLAAYVDEFPAGTVFVCVVDPGVGSARRPLVLQADGRWFVGPDNGLLAVIARRAQQARRWEITYSPTRLSASFHGRDLFAPVAAQLAMGSSVPGTPLLHNDVISGDVWPDDLYEIVYIDHYGNAMTGVRARTLDCGVRLAVCGQTLSYARTFNEGREQVPFWYENANGLVEIAVREASAASLLDLHIGDPVALVAPVKRAPGD